MKLMKIKDSYMFREKDPYKAMAKSRNAAHWYLVNDESDHVYVRELTHLYKEDNTRLQDIQSGRLEKIKIDRFEVPSGMYKWKKSKDARGKPLSMRQINQNSLQSYNKFKVTKYYKK